jgi:hypothetical protein
MRTIIMDRMASLYVDLPDRVARIDRRQTRYRFDLDTDIPWDRAGEPGPFHGKRLLADLGVDVAGLAADPEAAAAYDWALALATCLEFIELERGIEDFVGAERAALDGVQSVVWLVEEERKHVELFQRLASALRAARPDLVAAFDHAFHGTRGAPLRRSGALPRSRGAPLRVLAGDADLRGLHDLAASPPRRRRRGRPGGVAGGARRAPARGGAARRDRRGHDRRLRPRPRGARDLVTQWCTCGSARHRDRFFSLEAPERLVRERFPGLRLRRRRRSPRPASAESSSSTACSAPHPSRVPVSRHAGASSSSTDTSLRAGALLRGQARAARP